MFRPRKEESTVNKLEIRLDATNFGHKIEGFKFKLGEMVIIPSGKVKMVIGEVKFLQTERSDFPNLYYLSGESETYLEQSLKPIDYKSVAPIRVSSKNGSTNVEVYGQKLQGVQEISLHQSVGSLMEIQLRLQLPIHDVEMEVE